MKAQTEKKSVQESTFWDYVKKLRASTKSKWAEKIPHEEFKRLFDQTAERGLYIDGKTITLESRGGALNIVYDYRAYKNAVLQAHPESKFDIQLVRAGDITKFEKQSGKVIYEHKIMDGFEETEIIGAYCVIKNDLGEFLTRINREDIKKIRGVAKTQNVWKQWLDQMWLKSVIKRACKFHFYDLVEKIDTYDNEENYDLEKPLTPEPSDRKSTQLKLMQLLKEMIELGLNTESEDMRLMLKEKQESGELTTELMLNTIQQIETRLAETKNEEHAA